MLNLDPSNVFVIILFVLAVAALGGFIAWVRVMQRRVGRPSDDPADPVKRYSFFFHNGGAPPNL